MNPNSGEILENVDPEEARKRGLIPIPKSEEARVRTMSKEERIAWAKERSKPRAQRRREKAERERLLAQIRKREVKREAPISPKELEQKLAELAQAYTRKNSSSQTSARNKHKRARKQQRRKR